MPMPTDRGQPAGHLAGRRRRSSLADRGHGRDLEVGQVGGGEVDERLVERQRLDQRRQLAQQLPSPRWLVSR